MSPTGNNRQQLPQGITREVLEGDGLRAALAAAEPGIVMISDAAMRASIDAMLAGGPNGADPEQGVWVFGYGSLLWNPCVLVEQWCNALLYGYHRDFQIRLTHGRGSPEAPGLMLGLVPGGSCRGMALRLPAENLEYELLMVWRREMITGVYTPRWVTLHGDGRQLHAITFVTNPNHANFCGKLDDARVIEMLATGGGMIGTAADYLRNTVAHLNQQGISDRRLRGLKKCVEARLEPRESTGVSASI